MTLNYGQINNMHSNLEVELSGIQTVRVISTVREGFDIFLVLIFREDGKVENRSFFSYQAAMKKVNELAPKLAKHVQVERA